MDRGYYGFYTKRPDVLEPQKNKEDKDQQPPASFQQHLKLNNQPNQQSPNSKTFQNQKNLQDPSSNQQYHNSQQQEQNDAQSVALSASLNKLKDELDRTVKIGHSTTITLIDSGPSAIPTSEKDKHYITLETKTNKDDASKSSVTITKKKRLPVFENLEKSKVQSKTGKRPLQYLETLAEKAGITFDDKYEAANTLLELDKHSNSFRRPPELKQVKAERESPVEDDYRFRIQKEEDDNKQQIQQQIIHLQQQQLQHQQLQQQHLQQQQLQQSLQRQQQAVHQHIKIQQEQQDLLQKQFAQQQQHSLQQSQQNQHQQQQSQQVHQNSEQQYQQHQNQIKQELQQQKFIQVLNQSGQPPQQLNISGIGEINLSILPHLVEKGYKSASTGDIKPQQLVEGQPQVVQMSMPQHEGQQHHQTVTVVSSIPSSMHQQVQQQQGGSGMQQQTGGMQGMPQNAQHPHQLSADWSHGRVQVIQQPLQNNAYLQQLYNAQGPLLMPGNIALHPGINSQQIQVIATGKPFQGNQLAPHMITAQGKQVLQGQATQFPGYATIPGIPTTQNQTLVFSPLGVINSQSSMMPGHSQSTVSIPQQHQKQQQEMSKSMAGGKMQGGGKAGPVHVQVSQSLLSQQPQHQIITPLQAGGQTMHFAPWQISGALPQVWAGGLQASTLPTSGLIGPNPIFIRGNQQDGQPSMFIQHSPQNAAVQHNSGGVSGSQGGVVKGRAEPMAKPQQRPLSNILPSSAIRPASSVSTQTTHNQPANQVKGRGKVGERPPPPATKQDAANQTNKMPQQKQLLVMSSTAQNVGSSQDKQQVIVKNIQHHNMMLQQQQHYQNSIEMGTQSGAIQNSGVSQTAAIEAMPQSMSMVQQLHPVGGVSQQGGASQMMGQNSGSASNVSTSIPQVQAMQQQQTMVLTPSMVHTSVSMAMQQQPSLSHATSMHSSATAPAAMSVVPPPSTMMSLMQEQPVTSATNPTVPEDHKLPVANVPQSRSSVTSMQHAQAQTVEPPAPPPTAADVATCTRNDSPRTSLLKQELATTLAIVEASSSVPSPTPPPSASQSTPQVNVVTSSVNTSVSTTTITASSAAAAVANTHTFQAPAPPSAPSPLFKSGQSQKNFAHHCSDKGLPKAMVKPNIITHVIEGYVIQEASEPFAVNRPLRDWVSADREDKENKLPSSDEPPRKKQLLEGCLSRISSTMDTESSAAPSVCKIEVQSVAESADTPSASDVPKVKLHGANKWTVAEVCEFIKNIPGCANYAEEFLIQEVDGEALLLIKPEHLVMALSMKLGPALKIVACIDSLRPDLEGTHHD